MSPFVENFLNYCKYETAQGPRVHPLSERTLGRYRRGLKLVERLLEHTLDENITELDQVVFMERIMNYAQGTRRVSTQIFQRLIAWGIKNRKINCQNLIVGKEETIIGPDTPTKYKYVPKAQAQQFFDKLTTLKLRIVFGLMYFGGLTTAELAYVRKDNIVDGGLFMVRLQRNESLFVALPYAFNEELREYAGTVEGVKLIDVKDDRQGRHTLNLWFKAAQTETNELVGTTLRDLRISGIRHVFNTTQDLELTKEYAGAPNHKDNWVESLLDKSTYDLTLLARSRRYHGVPKTQIGK